MGLFGKSKPADPKEQVNEWTKKIRKEGFQLDRQINAIKREELKVTKSLKDAAKKGDKDVCAILAKEIVHSRKSVNKLYTAKANLNSVQLQMKGQLATLKVTGALQTSAEVMKSMQSLVKLPEIQKTMQEMSREMMKAGILEEMIEDTMETLEEGEEEETEVQAEIDKVLLELTAGALGKAPDALTETLSAGVVEPEAETPGAEEEVEDDLEEMKTRLEALRS
jgi:charged multivesicular body protein 3